MGYIQGRKHAASSPTLLIGTNSQYSSLIFVQMCSTFYVHIPKILCTYFINLAFSQIFKVQEYFITLLAKNYQ